jgi:phenylacetyl-CoA:acceptor oxidoreductase subunit 2
MSLQRYWDTRAAANFVFGGAGSSLLIFSPFLPHEKLVLLTGMILVAAGLGAVWLEIGRKLRAIHVFFNPFTSWMTRESFCAALLFAFGLAYLVLEERALLYGMAGAAAAFLYCQARILHAAKGIPAWRAPQVVPLIVATGLAEGAGLGLLFLASPELVSGFSILLLVRLWAWRRYRKSAKAPALEQPGRALVLGGTAAALALAFIAYFIPWAGVLAGLAAVAPGWWLKHALVTRAAHKQGFSLPHLPVRGTR